LLYGLLDYNGTDNNGSFYSINKNGTGFTKIYDVPGSYYLSNIPFSHSDGMIYFSTGTEVKKFNPTTSLFETLPLLRANINRQLTIDNNNWIYFVEGNQNPVIYKMKTDGTSETDLHALTGATDGWNALAGITVIPGDSLFGVMINGGTNDEGTIYSLKTDGSGFGVRHHFTLATGRYPESKLVYFDGKLYGTTYGGGVNFMGVIFSYDLTTSTYTDLYDFTNPTGSTPYGGVIQASNGKLYGMTYQGGTGGNGVIFSYDISGSQYSVLYNFDGVTGGSPMGALTQASNGKLFGTAHSGGANSGGVAFSYDIATGTYTVLSNFSMATGANPQCDFQQMTQVETGINSADASSLEIYADASAQQLVVQGSTVKNAQLIVVDALGKKVFEAAVNSQKSQFDLSSYRGGIYFVQLHNNQQTITRKIILTK